MTEPLRSRIHALASSFATSLLDAIRGSSLEELLGDSSPPRRPGRPPRAAAPAVSSAGRPRGRRPGRLSRRSAGDIAKVVERIVALLKQAPKGLRAEQIRDKLGLASKELPRPLKEALEAGTIGKSGQKRSTTYFVKSGGGTAATASPPRRARPGRRPAKRKAAQAARSARKAVRRTRRAKASRAKSKKATKAGEKAPVAAAPAAPEAAS